MSLKTKVLPRFSYYMPFWFGLSLFALISLVFVDINLDVSKFRSWSDLFSISTNILVGIIVSFVFYFFIVYIPESSRKRLIKASALKMYKNIKRDILSAVVSASIQGGRDDLTEDTDFVETLMSPDIFRANFEDGGEANEGFYAFENQMGRRTPEFEEIILNFELLEREIFFILGNYKFDDQEIFDLLKRIGSLLLRLKHSQVGYDESKPLCNIIWEVYAGWSFVTGYRGYDLIEKAISDI
jgi:hypothetical protein